ncbi:hypothetical protein HJD18_07020 [Thermoleophilia bacterium SCSIO 60948]|nr:hypothetical protein HJD18_07020 [Thermoleophilia bacterium SCSIO 60948]
MAVVAAEPPRRASAWSTTAFAAAIGLAAAVVVAAALTRGVELGVAILLGSLFVPVALFNLPLAAALWLPLMFVERVPAVGLGVTGLGLIVVGAWTLAVSRRRGALAAQFARFPAVWLAVAALLSWLTLSVAWAADPALVLVDVWNWWVAALLMVIVVGVVNSERHARWVAVAFVVGAALSVIAGLVPGAVAPVEGLEAGRFSGSFGDPNYLAAGLVPALAIAAALYASERSPALRAMLVATSMVLLVATIATGSRGGLLAIAAALIVALVLLPRARARIAVAAIAAIALAGAWITISSPETIDRVRSFDTNTGREDLWVVAWRVAEDNPGVGVGVNNFREVSPDYVRQPGSLERSDLIIREPTLVHNVYLQQFAETGIVGLVLLLALVVAVLAATFSAARSFARRGRETMSNLSLAVLLGQVSILTASFFLSNGYDKRIWFLFAIGVGLAGLARREEGAR